MLDALLEFCAALQNEDDGPSDMEMVGLLEAAKFQIMAVVLEESEEEDEEGEESCVMP
jgi:hypothetical protein